MSRKKRQEKLSVLLAQSHSTRQRVLRTRHEHVRRARLWVLLLAIGAAATGLIGVLHEFL